MCEEPHPFAVPSSVRLRSEVGDLLWLQLTDADHEESVTARRELVAAIRERRPADARDHAERHVATDTRRLLQLRLQVYGIRPAGVPGQGGRGRR